MNKRLRDDHLYLCRQVVCKMSRHTERELDKRSSSYSSHSSRSSFYSQNDLDKAYQELLSISRRDSYLRRYRGLDDQDRPLPNVWEGIEGLMEHVCEKFPMPQKALIEPKPETNSAENAVSRKNKRPQENVSSESREDKKLKLTESSSGPSTESHSSSGNPTVGDSSEISIIQSRGKDTECETLAEMKQKQVFVCETKEKENAQGDNPTLPAFACSVMEPGHGLDTCASENGQEVGEDSFMVLDSCGEVDSAQKAYTDQEDDQTDTEEVLNEAGDAEDLMLALASSDNRGAIAHNVSDSIAVCDVESEALKQESTSVATPDLTAKSTKPTPNTVTGTLITDTKQNDAVSAKFNLCTFPTVLSNNFPAIASDLSSNNGCLSNSSLQFERVLHQSCKDMDAENLKAHLQKQFKAFNQAVKVLCKQFSIVESMIMETSSKKERIKDSVLFKVSEIGCLVVALFSEMEVERMTQNAGNPRKFLKFHRDCPLQKEDKEKFINWYRKMKKELEKLVSQYVKLFDDFQSEIFKFNDRNGSMTGIKVPGLFAFSKDGRFSRFLKGLLKVFKVSSLLTTSANTKGTILTTASRKALCQMGSVYSSLPLRTTPKSLLDERKKRPADFDYRNNANESSQTNVKENFDSSKLCTTTAGSHQAPGGFLKSPGILENVSKDSSEAQSFPTKDRLNNFEINRQEPVPQTSQSKKAEKYSKFRERIVKDLQIPVGYEKDPGFHSNTYQYFDDVVEKLKMDQKHVKKRLYVLRQNLNKDESGAGPQTQKACIELVKLSGIIESCNACFEEERLAQIGDIKTPKWTFSPMVVADIGVEAAKYLSAKFTSLEMNLRSLYNTFNTIFCKHFETIQAYNNSEDGQQNGEVVVPPALNFHRKVEKKGYYTKRGSYVRARGGRRGHQGGFKNYSPESLLSQFHAHQSSVHDNFNTYDNVEQTYYDGHGYTSQNQDFNEFRAPATNEAEKNYPREVAYQDMPNHASHQTNFYSQVPFSDTEHSSSNRESHFTASSGSVRNSDNFQPPVPPPPLPPLPLAPSSNPNKCDSYQFQQGSYQSENQYAERENYTSDSYFSNAYSYQSQEELSGANNSRSFHHNTYTGYVNDAQYPMNSPTPPPSKSYEHTNYENAYGDGSQTGYWSCPAANKPADYNTPLSGYTSMNPPNVHSFGFSTNPQISMSSGGTLQAFSTPPLQLPNSIGANYQWPPPPKSGTMSRILQQPQTTHFNPNQYASTHKNFPSGFETPSTSSLDSCYPQGQDQTAGFNSNRNVRFLQPSVASSRFVNPGPSTLGAPPKTRFGIRATVSSSTSSSSKQYFNQTDGKTFLPGPSTDTSPKARLQSADPVEGVNIGCRCGCGGHVLENLPNKPDANIQLPPEPMHWYKLSLLYNDISTLSSKLNMASKWFDKLNRTLHKNACRIIIDVCATLPHLASIMKELRKDQLNHKFSEDMPYSSDEVKEFDVGVLSANSIRMVETLLCNVYQRHGEFYNQRKNVILRFHPHAERYWSIRKRAYNFGEVKVPIEPGAKGKVHQKNKKLQDFGVFSEKNETSQEKIKYYQMLFRVQKRVANIQKQIGDQKKIFSNKNRKSASSGSDSNLFAILKKCGVELMNLKKEMVRNEVYREMYGRYVPRYVQSLLKVKNGHKKTIDNHIKNYDFILKQIGRVANELGSLAQKLSPNLQGQIKSLEILKESV